MPKRTETIRCFVVRLENGRWRATITIPPSCFCSPTSPYKAKVKRSAEAWMKTWINRPKKLKFVEVRVGEKDLDSASKHQ